MKKLLFVLIISATLFWFSSHSSVYAATYSLSGTITNAGGAGIFGATVEVLELNTANVIANTTSSISGNYNMTVEEGTYDIRVTPPSNSGLETSLTTDYVISNNSVRNITLGGTSIVVSGLITDYQNNPLKNSSITLQNQTSGTYFYGQTDVNGTYSVAIPTGDYQFFVEGSTQANETDKVPQTWQAIANTITFTQNKTINYSVQVKKVEVFVKDPSNTPVENANVKTSGARNDQLTLGGAPAFTTNAYNNGIQTDGDGKAVLWLFPTDLNGEKYTIVVTPPAGAPNTVSITENVSVTEDRTLTVTVTPPVTINGIITDYQDNPLKNTEISLQSNQTNANFSSQTNLNGEYEIDVPIGNYRLFIQSSAQNNESNVVPEKWQAIAENISITQNITINYSVEVKSVEITVADSSNNPVENANVKTSGARNDQLTLGGATAFTTNAYDNGLQTDANGKAIFWLFPTDPNGEKYTFIVTPPAGNPNTIAVADNISVTGDRTLSITLSPPVTVSGTITGSQSSKLKNTILTFKHNQLSSDFFAQTDVNGNYSVDIPKGTYQILIEGSTQANELETVPQFWQVGVNALSINADKDLDYSLELKKMDLHVQNSSGAPLANSKVQVDGFITNQLEIAGVQGFGSSTYRDGVMTDSSGNVTLWLFPTNPQDGAYTFIVNPPVGSTYTVGILDNIEIETNTSRTVVLQNQGQQDDIELQPIADSYLKEGSPNQNEGASTFMRLQNAGNNRAMIKFDQSQIAAAINGAQNYTAKLQMTITDNGNNWGTTGRALNLHRMTQDWTEGNGFIENNNPIDKGTGNGTTWNCATDANISNGAANCSGADDWNMTNSSLWPFAAAVTAATTITNNQSGVVEFDVTSDVQSFISGENQNYGWLLKKENEGQNGRVEFGTKESGNTPVLVISFN